MEIWLDTIELELIQDVHATGILTGVTTNPALLSKADTLPEIKLQQILAAQSGWVAAQVVAADLKGMLTQARRLAALDARMIIKIPVTAVGLHAIAILSKENVPTMATAIFTSSQVVLAAVAGATYAAPYLSKIAASATQSLSVLQEMLAIITRQNYTLKLLAASITSTEQVVHCAKLGAHAITLPATTYAALLNTDAATEKSLVHFNSYWLSGAHTANSELFN